MARAKLKSGNGAPKLTDGQELELLIGQFGSSAFESPSDRERAWWSHRDRLLAAVNPLARPAGWWWYEMAAHRKPGEKDWQALQRLGLLTPAEQALLRKIPEAMVRTY